MSVAFSFAVVVIGAWTLSRGARALGLPAILGMLLFGVTYAALSGPLLPPLAEEIGAISGFLTTTALIVILLRAGLGIRMRGLRAIGGSAIRMAFIPCLLETGFATAAFIVLFGFDPLTALIGASILAAVSPAVVVPSMLDLKERGIGTEKDVPTLILAGASIDDVVAITIFTGALGLFTAGAGGQPAAEGAGVARAIINLPVSIVAGVGVGVGIGFLLSWFLSHYYERIRATEKALLLVMVSLLIVELGTVAPIASLLAVMTVGFILLERAEHVAHEMASKLSKLWVPAEIVLFVLIGLVVDLPTAARAGLPGLGVIGIGLVGRSIGVLASVLPDRRLNARERLFALIAYTPKATVQAALGAIPLAAGHPAGAEILSVAVLAIVVTAPLGLILIRAFGPRLLGGDTGPVSG
ncbi:MAG: peptidase [Spirochaetaceae bacterium]|nr:MAG: peptidase [Spirochaetaceae bacterium]